MCSQTWDNGQRGRRWPATSGHLGSRRGGGPHHAAAGGQRNAGRSSRDVRTEWLGWEVAMDAAGKQPGSQWMKVGARGGTQTHKHMHSHAEAWGGQEHTGEQSAGGWLGSRDKQV